MTMINSDRNKATLATNNNPQELVVAKKQEVENFEQPVILEQSNVWPQATILTILGVTIFGVGWACLAEIPAVVSAAGKLQPQSAVTEVKVPVSGVLSKAHVKDGDSVVPGDLLLSFDSTTAKANLESLENERKLLLQENQVYYLILQKNSTNLVSENKLFLQLSGDTSKLTGEQLVRLNAIKAASESRLSAAQLEVEQLERQLEQNQVNLANARKRLDTAQKNFQDIQVRNTSVLADAKNQQETEEIILKDLEPLVAEGAIAHMQYRRQKQTVETTRADIEQIEANGRMEYDRQLQEVEERKAELEQLLEEQKRLNLDIVQGKEESRNIKAVDKSNFLTEIVENKKRLEQIDSQITQVKKNLEYQELRAQEEGIVFDLQASKPGFVAHPGETILKIVPDGYLQAEVFVSNQDIGFVKPNMPVDVRIDSYNFNEYGDIKGKVVSVGTDALEPDQMYPFFRFPISISLEEQSLSNQERELLLQSGMSVQANIRISEDRKVISLLIDSFAKKVDSLKKIR